MSYLLRSINKIFWSERFWLPRNFNWKDFENKNGLYPQVKDLMLAFVFAVLFCLLRFIWEKYIAKKIGKYYQLSEEVFVTKLPHSADLEQAFQHFRGDLSQKDINILIRKTNLKEKQIKSWLKKRKMKRCSSRMKKFTETSWKFIFYSSAFFYGIFNLWNKSWFWDIKECWTGYPKQELEMWLKFYYVGELGFYISLVFSHFTDIRRKDFTQMLIHHLATILLLGMSWLNNMVRVGSLILCLHDFNDYWLEGAKMANYLKQEKLCNFLFLIFAVLWFFTRIIIFPFKIIKSTLFGSKEVLGVFGAFYFLNFLLILLFILHIFWFIIILKMLFIFILAGKVEKDSRSDSENELGEEEMEKENIKYDNNNNNNNYNNLVNNENNSTQIKNESISIDPNQIRLRNTIKRFQQEFGSKSSSQI